MTPEFRLHDLCMLDTNHPCQTEKLVHLGPGLRCPGRCLSHGWRMAWGRSYAVWCFGKMETNNSQEMHSATGFCFARKLVGSFFAGDHCRYIYIYLFIYTYIYIHIYIYIYIYIHVNQCPPAPVFIVFSLYPAGHFLSQLLGQNWGTFSHNIWDSSKLKVHNWWTKCCVSKYREPTIFGEIHIRHWWNLMRRLPNVG